MLSPAFLQRKNFINSNEPQKIFNKYSNRNQKIYAIDKYIDWYFCFSLVPTVNLECLYIFIWQLQLLVK